MMAYIPPICLLLARVDGSVRRDFPQEKMARLYNLNYTIASQVNPRCGAVYAVG